MDKESQHEDNKHVADDEDATSGEDQGQEDEEESFPDLEPDEELMKEISGEQKELESNDDQPRRSTRVVPKKNDGYNPYVSSYVARVTMQRALSADDNIRAKAARATTKGKKIKEPRTLKEAQAQPEWKEWKKALEAECKNMIDNGVFTIVDQEKEKKNVGNIIKPKLVFKVKYVQ